MMYSGKKFLLFSLLGILLGYLFHRLTLLYDSYTGNTLDKWTHLLMKGQDEVLQSPWNVSFTGKSSAFFLLGFVIMLLVYLYLETGKKQYREGVEYGSARFGTLKEKKLFYGKEFSHDTILLLNCLQKLNKSILLYSILKSHRKRNYSLRWLF